MNEALRKELRADVFLWGVLNIALVLVMRNDYQWWIPLLSAALIVGWTYAAQYIGRAARRPRRRRVRAGE